MNFNLHNLLFGEILHRFFYLQKQIPAQPKVELEFIIIIKDYFYFTTS